MRWRCGLWVLAVSGAVAAGPVETLRQRLDNGLPVTVVFMGDSISTGMHLEEPGEEGFPALFMQILRHRYPDASLAASLVAQAGAPTATGLALFEARVRPLNPNLVVLQYGGNDKGTDDGLDNLPGYEANLRELVTSSRALGAAVLLVAPPMHEPVLDMPFPAAARRIGQVLGVPVADFDTAIKRRGADYRGLFPYFIHPREHEHGLMARELYRAFTELLGPPLRLQLEVGPATSEPVMPGSLIAVPVELSHPEGAETVHLSARGAQVSGPHRLAAGEPQAAALSLGVPHSLPGGRSDEWPLLVSAALGAEHAYALARATLVPIFNVPVAGTPAAALPLVRLGAPHLVVGRGVWKGPDDLSATVRMAADSEHLRLEVAVTDEKLTTGGVPNYDGVELFLDLRDDANRGRPHFTRQCITLFLHPALDGAPRVGTLTDDQPPPALLDLPLQCAQRDDGYTLSLDLPRALLDEIAGRRVTRLGLDLGVDDSDSNGRECQLMWLGRADNYVNPRRLGEFRLDDPAPLGSLRLTVF